MLKKQYCKPLVVGLVIMLLAGCSADIKQFKAPVVPNEKFSNRGVAPIVDKWWLAFEDTELNHLIDYALTHNFTLLATYDRLAQARAIAKKSGAELTPQLKGSFKANRNHIKNTVGQSSNNDFSVGLAASYEVDLWGRIRFGMQAAVLDEKSAQQDVQIAAITLSAEVTSTWYKLIDQRLQAALLDKQIKINQDNADVLFTRFRLGQARAADVFQQKELLQATIGDKAIVSANIKSYEYQLATLLGKPVNTLTLSKKNQFPVLPAKPDTGLSSELIQRRPDIYKAYLAMQAADQRLAAAVVDRFPKLSLSASLNSNTPDLQSLFNNWLATLAGNIVLPLIDGHRRIAEIERNQAVFSATVNQYGTVILRALQEVEIALIREQQQAVLLASLEQQLILSKQAYEQIQLRYRYGGMDFLRVLSSRLSVQALERRQIRTKRELIDFRINLYKALAGGWSVKIPVAHKPTDLIKK